MGQRGTKTVIRAGHCGNRHDAPGPDGPHGGQAHFRRDVRNGAGTANTYARGTGLHGACLPWLHERRVALLSSDPDSDVHPPLPEFKRWSEPIHMIAIPYMGMPLLCIAGLDEISAACAEEGRWHFFLNIAPWRFKGATSSPVNPLAIF
ncbi:MAG: hypothetical protein WCA06_02825 [Terrimicrobiaceae bacterium]